MDMIEGVIIQDLKIIPDERGPVMHMLRSDSPLYSSFGEIYFSTLNPKCIKAWRRHLKMNQHFAVPVGKIKLVIYDSRMGSRTQGMLFEYYLGPPDHYKLIKIPPLLWYGFQSLSESASLIANMTDIPHDAAEIERAAEGSVEIPFNF